MIHQIKEGVTAKRRLPFIFAIAAEAFLIAAFILYIAAGKNTFTPVLSSKVITMMWISMILGMILCVFEIKILKHALFLLTFWTWLEYIFDQMSYISNVLVGIDGNSFHIGFIGTILCGLMAWVCALLSANMQKGEWKEAA